MRRARSRGEHGEGKGRGIRTPGKLRSTQFPHLAGGDRHDEGAEKHADSPRGGGASQGEGDSHLAG